MKHCNRCNLEFPESYKFCGSCGGPISEARRCPGCDELVEGQWTFCTSCGTSLMTSGADQSVATSEPLKPAVVSAPLPAQPASPARQTDPPPTLTLPASISSPNAPPGITAELTTHEWYSAPDLFEETTATHPAPEMSPVPPRATAPPTLASPPPVTHEPVIRDQSVAPTLTMLAAYGKTEAPPQSQWWQGVLLGLLVLLLFGGVGFGGWYWWTHRGSTAQNSPPIDSNVAPDASNPGNSPAAKSTSTPSPGQLTSSRSADDEVKRLRERRLNSKPGEGSEIVAAFEAAEKKYPADYRLPYERAKLSIAGVTSHHEAFSALAGAAGKAIDNGKSQEMLDSLLADKDGDFHKLSRGHREWQTLIDALGKKEKQHLSELHH